MPTWRGAKLICPGTRNAVRQMWLSSVGRRPAGQESGSLSRHAGGNVGRLRQVARCLRYDTPIAARCGVGVAVLIVVSATALVLVIGQQRLRPMTDGVITGGHFCVGADLGADIGHDSATRNFEVRHAVQQPKCLSQHQAGRQESDLPALALLHEGFFHCQLSPPRSCRAHAALYRLAKVFLNFSTFGAATMAQ